MGLLFVLTLAAIGVVGDILLKLATHPDKHASVVYFLLGTITYAATAVGWFLVLKYMPLGKVGIYYSIATAVLLFVIGAGFFKEPIKVTDILALSLALVSVLLLRRFE